MKLIVGSLGLLAVMAGAAFVWIIDGESSSRPVVADPAHDRRRSSLELEPGGNGFGLAVEQNGIWVLSGTVSATNETWSVVHVDPAGEKVSARIPLPASPIDIATGAGAVWVTTLSERDGPLHGTLLRVDPATDRVSATLPLEVVGGIAVTENAIWVTAPKLGALYRVDPETMTLVATVQDIGATFATFAFDRVWVTDVHGGELVGVDPTSNEVVSTTAIGELPAWTAATTQSLWVTLQRPPTVAGVDPAEPAITSTVSVPARIVAMTADGDNVWVATNEPASNVGTIYRIDAATTAIEVFDASEAGAVTDLIVDGDVLWAVGYLDAELVRASIKR